ncbi:MAG: 5'-3' exonuclease [Candidatus Woesebacteria bacterium]|nr:5'-3' exonuclease [Candidatus Woesebacteria bacterium]
MSKLVLIDAFAILHRAFHAIPPLTNKKGEPTNAIYGFVSIILRVIGDLNPDYLAVCFDVKVPTFRHKEFKEYQSQRPPMADELSSQIGKAKDFLQAAGIPIYLKEGYEADDLLGTIAKKGDFDSVVIVTGDKDILQLVDKKIKIYMPIVGLSSAKLFGEEEAKERMGVLPIQIPDYKALVGDPSDNYPGVSGIGPKTAEKLLEKYPDIDKIYAHLEDIDPKIRTKLEAGKKDVLLFHRLATIVKDVDIKIDFAEMKKWNIASPDVLKLFEEFGFKTLTKRIKEVGEKIDQEKQGSLF